MSVKVDDVIATYMKLRSQKEAIEAQMKEQTAAIKAKMEKLESWIKEQADVQGVTSFKTKHGTAFLVRHDPSAPAAAANRTWIFSETGDLILAEFSRQGYRELGRTHILVPTNECFGREVVWSHPAFSGRCVFARNDQELVCISLAE